MMKSADHQTEPGHQVNVRNLLGMILLVATVSPVAAQPVQVTDGDTIKLEGTIYRLWGIDAPETKQFCDGYPAGLVAAATLKAIIGDRTVTCEPKATDRYGRTVALCRADGEDLGEAMVKSGMAYAFVRYSRDYVATEEQARSERIGLHIQQCELPWEWRARNRGDR